MTFDLDEEDLSALVFAASFTAESFPHARFEPLLRGIADRLVNMRRAAKGLPPRTSHFTMPTHCYSCGAVLRGADTLHVQGCEVRKMIEEIAGSRQ